MKFHIIFLVMTIFMAFNLHLNQAEQLDAKNDYTIKNTNFVAVPGKLSNSKESEQSTTTQNPNGNNQINANHAFINTTKDTKPLTDPKLNSTEVTVKMTGKEYSLWERFKKFFGW